jgi:hypothetical protein
MPSIAADRGRKARVSERSEFRAAPIREKRRAPMRLYCIGMRPAKAVLVPFAKTSAFQQPNGWSKEPARAACGSFPVPAKNDALLRVALRVSAPVIGHALRE